VEVTIRPATDEDQQGVRRLMRGERVNPFGIDWRNFVVAEDASGIVGCVQLRPAGRGAVELGSGVVRAGLRRRGLGARLVDAALARAGGRRVFMVTAAGREPYFARWGFRPVGLAAAPWPVRRNWLLGQAGSLIALAHGLWPRRLVILAREGRP
jgi:N-acetylglutamate synthase-like GNAT family acetyltransferase